MKYGNNGLKFGRVHNKMDNILSYLHPLQEGEADLVDYSLIAIDVDIIATLKEWLKEVHGMLQILNMTPSNQASVANKL